LNGLFSTVIRYAPAAIPVGSVAVMLLSVKWVTVSWLVPSVTLGVLDPNPSPVIVIAVPPGFSVTYTMKGKSGPEGSPCWATTTEQLSRKHAKSTNRRNMSDLLGVQAHRFEKESCAHNECWDGFERKTQRKHNLARKKIATSASF
jgi:hypothetical protein